MSFNSAFGSQGMKIITFYPEQQIGGCKQYLVPVSAVISRGD